MREQLAAVQHDIWRRNVAHYLTKYRAVIVNEDGSITLPKSLIDNFIERDVPYEQLRLEDRGNARMAADNVLELISDALTTGNKRSKISL